MLGTQCLRPFAFLEALPKSRWRLELGRGQGIWGEIGGAQGSVLGERERERETRWREMRGEWKCRMSWGHRDKSHPSPAPPPVFFTATACLFPHHRASLRHQLGVAQLHSTLPLQLPADGVRPRSVLGDCPLPHSRCQW